MDELYELKEMLCEELKQYGEKDLTAGSLEVVDKLAHTIKNLDKIMEEYDDGYSMEGSYADGGGGMSSRANRGTYRGSYRGGNSYNTQNSMARRRDSMGRYSSRRRYSRDGLADKLRELMEEAPDEQTKQEIRKLADKMESN